MSASGRTRALRKRETWFLEKAGSKWVHHS